jgi:hypothetical protein
MSEEDTQSTSESESEVRGAELRENLALTDARRAEEEVAKAHEAAEKAREQEEKLARKEQELRAKAERVHAEADRARAAADEARATVSGAHVASPGVGTTTEPDAQAAAGSGPAFPGADRLPEAAQRTEVLVGAAFVGSFVLARVLKRIFD